MMGDLKPSEQFRLHFQQLKSACDDSPTKLITFFRERPQFTKLAWNVDSAAGTIDKVSNLRKIHPQVSTEFIQDWKDYRHKWRKQIAYVVAMDLNINLGEEWGSPPTFEEFVANRGDPYMRDAADANWEDEFFPDAHDGGEAVNAFLALAADRAMDRRANGLEPEFIANTYLIGIEALEYFQNTIGIHIQSTFNRWNGLPAVFVPKHVSDRHGITANEGLFALHGQAVRAYVAGAPAAATAMCRALLEMVLREHYLRGQVATNESLKEVIDIAAAKYDFLPASKMHKLRVSANKFLHDYRNAKERSGEDEFILGLLKDLKFYIERAPIR